MFKLLVTLVTFLLLALAVMGMRHHARELESQTAGMVHESELRKHRLQDQGKAITEVSNPITLAQNMKDRGLSGDVGVLDLPRPRRAADDPGDLVAPVRRR
jgi:hypothetical protein